MPKVPVRFSWKAEDHLQPVSPYTRSWPNRPVGIAPAAIVAPPAAEYGTPRKVTAGDLHAELSTWLLVATESGVAHLDVSAHDLHRQVGGYPGPGHAMPQCCRVMRAEMRECDEVLAAPPMGNGASFTVRYLLPR